jgi:hypothetical protein
MLIEEIEGWKAKEVDKADIDIELYHISFMPASPEKTGGEGSEWERGNSGISSRYTKGKTIKGPRKLARARTACVAEEEKRQKTNLARGK